MYASVFFANLGSLGLDAVYHHMYEWGNAPFFIVVGKRKKEPANRFHRESGKAGNAAGSQILAPGDVR